MNFIRQTISRFTGVSAGPSRAFVGKDHIGNKYYLIKDNNEERRVVDYAGNGYLDGIQGLPTLWRSWILKTRAQPPTPIEIEQEVKRQLIMQERIRRIDERNRAARATEGLSQDLRPFLRQLTGEDIGHSQQPRQYQSAFSSQSEAQQSSAAQARAAKSAPQSPHSTAPKPSPPAEERPEVFDINSLKQQQEFWKSSNLKDNL